MEENIRIEWDGPYTLADIGYLEDDKYSSKESKLNNKTKDYGIYQVYGHHPVYGNNVLLYIGKADEQTFSKRLSQESWHMNQDSNNIQFYVGRLFSKEEPTLEKWSNLINIAERMLIFAHSPAMNSSNILTISRNIVELKKFENVRIFNYDNCRSLLPEISGELWIKKFEDFNGVFTCDE